MLTESGGLAELARPFSFCPIESGVLGYLADHECAHGRLPTDHSPPCGCWPEEQDPGFARLKSRPSRTAISTEEVRELMNMTTVKIDVDTDPEAPFGRKADGTPRKRPYPRAAIEARWGKRAVSNEDAAALTPNGDPKGWPAQYRAGAARMEAEAAAIRATADRKATRLEERATWLRNAADKLQGKR